LLLAAWLGGCSGERPRELTATARPLATGGAAVLTQHVDAARTGLYASETQLTWASVPTSFGKLFTVPVDGRLFAQPLYVPGVTTFLGNHDLVILATENNSVYAVDAHSGSTIWTRSLGTPIPSLDAYPSQCLNIPGTIGITGTPVIDPSTNTIYLVNANKNVDGTYHQYFNALDVATGAPRSNSPREIGAQYPGDGPAASNGLVAFDPLRENQRAGLLLLNNKIYVAWSSHCDDGLDYVNGKPEIFFGWIMSFDPNTLGVVNVFNTAPHADPNNAIDPYGGSIWHGAGGLASDGNRIYANTGNALFDPAHGDWGDSTLALSSSLTLLDSFTPSDQATLDAADLDFSAGGVVVVPTNSVPQHPNLLVATGKEGTIFVLDRDHLGGAQPAPPGADIICPPNQPASGCVVAERYEAVGTANGDGFFFGLPAYFNNTLYFAGNGDHLKSFALGGSAGISPSFVNETSTVFQYPGSTPAISSNGTADAIVWALERTQPGPFMFPDPTHLHAYRADNLTELYNSQTKGEDPANAGQFMSPTIAGGQVYIGTSNSLAVYGLFLTVSPTSQSVIQGNATTYAVSTAFTGASVTLSATGLPAGATASFAPATVSSGGGSTLTITTATTTPVGTYPITVVETAGSTSHSTAATLVVLKRDQPPTAAFTFSCVGRQCSFDGTSSHDAEGPIATYAWSFGDGAATATTATTSHNYAVNNTYSVTLTVSDSAGQTNSVTHALNAVDTPPTAAFTFSCAVRQCSFNGLGSHDPDGPIFSYAWSFGDGATDSPDDVTPTHLYAANGTYNVTLTVTDSIGQSSSITHSVTAIDQPPHAAFSMVCSDKTCTVDAEASSDDVGIVRFTWSWGDGSASFGGSPFSLTSHTYAAYGTYPIMLTVTDTVGQTGTSSRSVLLKAGPKASFTHTCLGRSCSFNAAGSSGPATIVNYHWDFDDETSFDTAVATAGHGYGYGATFRVSLTVTDVNGDFDTITVPVVVN
jgi:PKD repeat protein